MKDIIRMNQLAGIITEGQAKKMMEVLNENNDEVKDWWDRDWKNIKPFLISPPKKEPKNTRKSDKDPKKDLNSKEEATSEIVNFLRANKQELLSKISEKFPEFDEDVIEDLNDEEIIIGNDIEGEPDIEIAALGESGIDFSFNWRKVKSYESTNFKFIIAGKPVYGIAYDM
jgi:hypothetical protein